MTPDREAIEARLPLLDGLQSQLREPFTYPIMHPTKVGRRLRRALRVVSQHAELERLGFGSCRIIVAFGVPGVVAKIGMGEWGRFANEDEMAFWLKHRDDEVGRILCPPVCLSRAGVLVQRRAKPTQSSQDERDALKALLIENGGERSDWPKVLATMSSQDVFEIDGRKVVVDFHPTAPPSDSLPELPRRSAVLWADGPRSTTVQEASLN